MQKWEYLRVIIEVTNRTIYEVFANGENIFDRHEERKKGNREPVFDLNEYLETKGHDGWELISVMPANRGGYTDGIHYYFKRPIE